MNKSLRADFLAGVGSFCLYKQKRLYKEKSPQMLPTSKDYGNFSNMCGEANILGVSMNVFILPQYNHKKTKKEFVFCNYVNTINSKSQGARNYMTRDIILGEKRDCKGIWFPIELYSNIELNWNEKIILLEINSLSKNGECFASNQHFADMLGVSKKRVEGLMHDLRKKGYITTKIIYKDNTKQVVKRILRVVDPYRFGTEYPYPQNQGEATLRTADSPTQTFKGDKNTSIKNPIEKNNNEDNIECHSLQNDTSVFPKELEDRAGRWSWKSDKEYLDYIEKVLPKFIREIAKELCEGDENAYSIFLRIITTYYKMYRHYNGKYHPWYKKETIKEVLVEIYDFFGHITVSEVKEFMEQFFSHEKLRCKPMKVFSSHGMLEVLQNELDQDWTDAFM